MKDDLERDWMPQPVDGPTHVEAKAALAAHVEEPEPGATDLPTDVEDGEAG